ncbi:LPD7 domain-containing protein [Methylobacterium iners]|uniref:Large polyvalent protein-associated domain-containing protein n=1 Tax=Methylobacterium iners TaxID=418707 RepID=A0ABQ4RWW1_9HYPH|nr:LPD7 domain-containing protein [Methylobacterium iners]GJD94457.1 hypothetical protein OCOJLMKI_1659 [Methylobacterium iners]
MTDEAGEFAVERSARIKSTPAQPRPERQPEGSHGIEQEDRSGFPDRIRRKYYVVAAKVGLDGDAIHARIYTDRQGEYLAFKATGDRLSTRNEAPEVVRDMIAVAEHRGWEAVSVRGPVEFRREAWLEATARGLPLRGFEPAELDHETLRKRLADRVPQRSDPARPAPDLDASSTTKGDGPSPRANLDVGVTGRLVEVGRAPYSGRQGAESSAYVDLALGDGSSRRIWGAALPKAVEAAKVEVGDGIRIQRNGVERVAKDIRIVDGRTGTTSVERQDVVRNRWTFTAEQFRSLDQREAVRDPSLAAAHSNIAVLERALKTRFPQDERARHIMLDAARQRVAEHLEQGRTFRRAEIRVSERTSVRDAVEPPSRIHHRREERLQTRERGRDR